MTDLVPTAPTVPALAEHEGMLLATTDELPGFEIVEVLGLVRGNAVRVRHLGVDILAGFRNLVGGEVRGYTKMLAETREQALDRLRAAALARGADAVVGVRVTTSMVMQGAAEILCYGTAVRVRRTEGV